MPRYIGQGLVEKMGELAGLPPEDREVAAYGLEYLLSGTIGLALMLLIGLALGCLWETLAMLCSWVLLRTLAGGAHCTALWRCTIVNCLGLLAALPATAAAVYLFPPALWIGAATAWTLLAAWLWAPNNSERPVHDPGRRVRLRRKALILVLLIGASFLYFGFTGTEPVQILTAAGATGLACGGFMISPAGFRSIRWLDQKLVKLGQTCEKGGEKP
ncbi:MAG: accessory gene regulator B family protein [Bacillota bacterium]